MPLKKVNQIMGGGREKQEIKKASDLKWLLQEDVKTLLNTKTASNNIPIKSRLVVKPDNLSMS
ncbi:MAG: hypothetical protein Q7J05_08010 [Paludibacter sp.]|nr:hypothetical protein [Paludibacter sp.]